MINNVRPNGKSERESNLDPNPPAWWKTLVTPSAPPSVSPLAKKPESEISLSPSLYMYQSLFDHGKDRAITSGALEPSEIDLKAVQEHAAAMARETRRDLYDPKVKYQDFLREEEHKKNLVDRAEAELACKHSAASVRDAELALAKIPSSQSKDGSATWIIAALIVGLSVTIVPTLHDVIFAAVPDGVFAWLFSLASSGFLAGAIVWAILNSTDGTGKRSNFSGLIAGVVVSVGLGMLRWSVATEPGDVLMALALTIVEIGLVIFAERVSIGLKESQTAHCQASSTLDAANAEHQRRQEWLQKLNDKIAEHIRYVEERDLRNVNLNEVIAVALKATVDGYYAGIAINRGGVIKSGGPR